MGGEEGVTRPVWEIADELVQNVTDGEFGKAFKSVRFTDVDDPADESPGVVVIVAVGETAVRINQAYTEAVDDSDD